MLLADLDHVDRPRESRLVRVRRVTTGDHHLPRGIEPALDVIVHVLASNDSSPPLRWALRKRGEPYSSPLTTSGDINERSRTRALCLPQVDHASEARFHWGVSFDLFAQLFVSGQASPVRVPEVLDFLRPFLIVGPEEDGFCRTRTTDGGEADFYLGDGVGHFMVNHFSKGLTSELIQRAASSRGLVLFGPGMPAMLTDADQLGHLPEPLATGPPLPVLVASGQELGT